MVIIRVGVGNHHKPLPLTPEGWQGLGPKDLVDPNGFVSDQKLPSDISMFGYIADYRNRGKNQQTTGFRATSTVYDEYWEWAEYDEDGNRIETNRRSQRGYPSSPSSLGDCGFWLYGSQILYMPYGEERLRGSLEYDIGMGEVGYAGIGGKGRFVVFYQRSNENSRQPSGKIYVVDTRDNTWSVYRFGSSYTRQGTVKKYETDDTIRFYWRGSWDGGGSDYYGGYIDVDKNTGEIGTLNSLPLADVMAMQNTHPTGMYKDLDTMEILINLETSPDGYAYFNGEVVGNGYFKRGRDNKKQQYCYQPVFTS